MKTTMSYVFWKRFARVVQGMIVLSTVIDLYWPNYRLLSGLHSESAFIRNCLQRISANIPSVSLNKFNHYDSKSRIGIIPQMKNVQTYKQS